MEQKFEGNTLLQIEESVTGHKFMVDKKIFDTVSTVELYCKIRVVIRHFMLCIPLLGIHILLSVSVIAINDSGS